MSARPVQPPAPATLDDPPAGFRWRRPREQDLDDLVALYDAVARTRDLDRTTAQDLRLRWDGPRWFDDGLVLERDRDGLLAAYAQFTEDVHLDGEVDLFIDGRVHPEATGHGLATFLLQRGERRAWRAAERVPPTARLALRTTNDNGNDRARRLYERLGFVAIRHLLTMRIDLRAAGALDVAAAWGAQIRAVDPEHDLPAVWRAMQRGFADHWSFEPTSYDDWRYVLVERSDRFDPALWFVAESGGEVVGAAICHAQAPEDPGMGIVQDLAVVPGWRRRHVAMALLRQAFRAFSARGLARAGLEVDDVTLDGALRLYERAGMAVARRVDVYEKELRPGR